ncbi:glycosyl transferase family 2 [Silicimonas algicola]|uniref:Glycosyl transferase family 2 n=1 Tax=Silicimonas algicola TaxID=1826607 RepID=A0A316G814_9RHOB|nr:glycosyltransferase family 2 protein [Silicimonas algicola]PWK56335.1 glycosyl transferase family 2 [Silicimonas algicola]
MAQESCLLVTTVKDEGANILEWVAHHRLCGFDRIQIYQNNSTDTTVQTLRILDRLGIIEFHQNNQGGDAFQIRAYRRAARSEAFAAADWCMVLDGDELLNVKVGEHRVQDLIAACPDTAQTIIVNWRIFGSGGEGEIKHDLVSEQFTRAEAKTDILERLTAFKPLFRTDSFRKPGIHLPRDPVGGSADKVLCNASGLMDGEFRRKHWRSCDPGMRQFAQVNHYILRDLTSFLVKHARGSANAPHRDLGLNYWRTHNRNEAVVTSLADRAPAIRDEMRRLNELSDGRLMPLRARAVRQHRLRVEEMLKDDAVAALRDAILAEMEAAPVPPVEEAEVPASTSRAIGVTPFRLPDAVKRQAVFHSVRAPAPDTATPGSSRKKTVRA